MKLIAMIPAGAIGLALLSTTTFAQDASAPKTYPACSKSVQGECVNAAQTHHAKTLRAVTHMKRHHRH